MRPLRVTASRKPALLHDYGEYPAWLQRVSYPCSGSPTLAADVVAALKAAGQDAVVDLAQGLDFSTWMPLSLMYSSGKVPIVQISLPAGGSPEDMIEDMMAVGKALAPLRQAGVMLIGTGAIVHNPHRARHDNLEAPAESWARAFDDWVGERLAVDGHRGARRVSSPRAACPPLGAHRRQFLDPLFFVGVDGRRSVVTLRLHAATLARTAARRPSPGDRHSRHLVAS